jgi:hypothetical protein
MEQNVDYFEDIELGPLKTLDDITIDDMKQYPIWVNDFSGESLERPVINNNDVTEKMISKQV